ncbi:MAG: transporter substrate-binding domain-containing protein [Pseudomonadota bacterium]
MTSQTHEAILAEFAPKGVLRVALNQGNPILVGKSSDGAPSGITVALARALGRHLGLDMRFVEYERAALVSADAEKDKWDVCFLASDPKRAQTIDFTKPYLQIEGSYLAGPLATAHTADELVSAGQPIGVVEGSAYTLTLQRQPGSENLVIFKDFDALLKALDDGNVAAIAGIHGVMQAEADKRPGGRVLAPPFMKIRQAMGMPQGRPGAKAFLDDWLNVLVQNGTVGTILEEHGVDRACLII